MKVRRRESKGFSTAITTIIAALIIIGVGIYVYFNGIAPQPKVSTPASQEAPRQVGDTRPNTANWPVYRSERFDFEIKYPPGWEVATTTKEQEEIAPMVTIYRTPVPEDLTPPFDHFANATHVSFYPEGIPTEGVVAPRATTSIALSANLSGAYDVLLDNNGAFATEFRFTDAPQSWKPWGFIWARVHVPDLESRCISSTGEELSREECDPLASEHRIIWQGTVNKELRDIEAAMLSTFRFTGSAATSTVGG